MVGDQVFNESDIIFKYTAQDALNDGVFARLGKSNHLVTSNLLNALQKKHSMELDQALSFILNETLCLVAYAFKADQQNEIFKTNYMFKVGNFKHSEIIWMMPNELGGLTLMKPEDY